MMEDLLCMGLGCSLMAGVAAFWFAVLVLCIDLAGRRWLSAGQRGVLWGLVLLRLLVPIAPASVASLQNLPELWSHLVPTPAPAPDTKSRDLAVIVANPETAQPNPALPEQIAARRDELFDFREAALPFLWAIGAAWVLGTTLLRHQRFSRHVHETPECRDERLLATWNDCLTQAQVRRRVPIIVGDFVGQPAVLGWLRPELLLPPSATSLSDESLRMVMLHELGHIRRWDVAANWLMLFIKALHWWNPLYWLAVSRIQSLREQACDAFVLRQMPESSPQDYGALLLEFADQPGTDSGWRIRLAASILGLTGTGRKWLRFLRTAGLRRRLRALRHSQIECSRRQRVLVAALMLFAAAGGLTDARALPPLRQPRWMDRHPHTAFRAITQPISDGPIVVRTYNIQSAIDRIAGDLPNRTEAEAILRWEVRDLLNATESAAKTDADREHPWFQISGDELKVGASAGVHQELGIRLAAWKQGGLAQVAVECRIIESRLNSRLGESVKWETPPVGPQTANRAPKGGGESTIVSALKPQIARRFIELAQGSTDTNLMHAPKVTLLNGQFWTISDCVSRGFTIPQRRPDGTMEPEIQRMDEGMKIAARIAVGERIRVTGDFEVREFFDVRTYTARLNSGHSATIEIPAMKTCYARLDSEVDDEDSILIQMPSHEDGTVVYVLLTFRKLEMRSE